MSSLYKDRFAEIFFKLKKFYLCDLNLDLEIPLIFNKEIPFPPCLSDIILEDTYKFQYGFYLFKDILVLFTKKYLIFDPCGSNILEKLPFGWIDYPNQGVEILGDELNVQDWALDADGESISKIYFLIDGNIIETEIERRISREDVRQKKAKLSQGRIFRF